MHRKIPIACRVSLSILGMLTVLLAQQASAASAPYVIFDSIPSAQECGVVGGTVNGNTSIYSSVTIFATQFTPSTSGMLTSIDLNLFQYGSPFGYPTARIDVSLTLDGPDGKPSGSILTSGTISISSDSSNPLMTTFLPSGQVSLQDGTPYWLVLAPHDSTTSAAWIYSCASTGFVAFANTPDPTSQDWHKVFLVGLPETYGIPEFRVSAVPEPSILCMSLMALALAIYRMLRSALKRQRG